MALLRGTDRQPGRYYPQQKDPRLNEDLRIVYQLVYDAHSRADRLQDQVTQLLNHPALKGTTIKSDGQK